MAKPFIITALDIGSGCVKLLSVFKKPREEDFEILGHGEKVSLGVRKGVVIDSSKVAETISSLVKKIEEDSGQKIDSVYASIGGGHIFSASSRGLVSVSRADRKISEEDIHRVLQAARTISLPSNKEITQSFPKEFIVDGEAGIKDAVGMEGVRLEADVLILGCFSPYLKNSSKSIVNSGLQINDLIPTPLASSRAVMTSREKELGACVLDIGAGTTSMAVFEEGSLIHAAVFPIGSGHITNDIAVCLKTDIDTAEKIKKEYGICRNLFQGKKDKGEKKIKIESSDEETEESLVFSKKMLAEIIEARVSEIFDLTNKELKSISKQAQLPAGIVLTGGGAKVPGIKELAKKKLKLPVRIGTALGFANFKGDPSLSTLYGLILEGIEGREVSSGQRKSSWLKRLVNTFIP